MILANIYWYYPGKCKTKLAYKQLKYLCFLQKNQYIIII